MPGADWRAEIRHAIVAKALVFIVCFSRQSLARTVSYLNEELRLAVEQLRQRRPGQIWLIPVRFDDCQIPDFDIGGGATLGSIQCADLFGDHRDEHTARVVVAVRRIAGESAAAAIGARSGLGVVVDDAPAPQKAYGAGRYPSAPYAVGPAPGQGSGVLPPAFDRRVVNPGRFWTKADGSVAFSLELLSFASIGIGPLIWIRAVAGIGAVISVVLGVLTFPTGWRRVRFKGFVQGVNSAGFTILVLTALIFAGISPSADTESGLTKAAQETGDKLISAWILVWALGNVACAVLAFVRTFRGDRDLNLILCATAGFTAVGLALAVPALWTSSYTILTISGSAFAVAFLLSCPPLRRVVARLW